MDDNDERRSHRRPRSPTNPVERAMPGSTGTDGDDDGERRVSPRHELPSGDTPGEESAQAHSAGVDEHMSDGNEEVNDQTAPAASARLLFLLDITGSMAAELEAVKGAMKGLCHHVTCSEQLQQYSGELAFSVITFTESSSSGCHTSLYETTSAEAAQQYMDTIALSCPPEQPHCCASGDDHPENHKAALARMTDLDPTVPTVAFLITDAPPHLQTDRMSSEARHELNYLVSRGVSQEDAKDVFKTFQHITLAHFGGNLILNCVVFNSDGYYAHQPSEEQLLFGSFAQQTGGMLMQPDSRDSSVLSQGLVTVVQSLLERLVGQGPAEAGAQPDSTEQLQGFKLIDLSGVTADRASEQEHGGAVKYGDADVIFNIAMDRMVAVCGKKWSKRAIGMTAPGEQLQFVWRAARYISLCAQSAPADPEQAAQLSKTKADELDRLLKLRETIVEAVPESAAGHFSINEQSLKQMAEEAAAWGADGGGSAAVSAISLESVGDALEDEAVWEDWLHSVMKLLMGFPVQMQLPLDANDQPDFMDSWSAVMEDMGVDRFAASEFMKLVKSGPSAKGLTDKRDYNSFLVSVDPADKLASMVFRIASATQVLDYVTAVLMGGKGFLPHLHAGITAACLTKRLSQSTPLTEFQWTQVQEMAHVLTLRHVSAVKAVSTKLLAGQANPEDAMSKFVLALLRITRKPYSPPSASLGADSAAAAAAAAAAARERKQQLALVSMLQEWLGSMVQRRYGKLTPENDDKYLRALLPYIPVEVLCGDTTSFDPLKQLSPLETIDPATLSPDALPPDVLPSWQKEVMQRVLGSHPGQRAHPVVAQFLQASGRLLALLLPPGSAAAAAAQSAIRSSTKMEQGAEPAKPDLQNGPAAALDLCWPAWQPALLEALLLRFRKARYTYRVEEQPPPAASTAAAGPAGATEAAAAAATATAGTTSTGLTIAGSPNPAAPALAVPAADTAPAAAPVKVVVWEPAPATNCLALIITRLQQALTPQLKEFKQARLEEAKSQLLAAVTKLLSKDPDSDVEAASSALKQLELKLDAPHSRPAANTTATGPAAAAATPSATLLGHTFSLQRKDVPAVLEQLGASCSLPAPAPTTDGPSADAAAEPVTAAAEVVTGAVTPSILRVLVLGDWCSQGAQVLRRSVLVHQLCIKFGSCCDDLMSAVKAQEVCVRVVRPNRHAHIASMPYPGAAGWTVEYAAARLDSVAGRRSHKRKKVEKGLADMERFTAMANWAKQAAAGNPGQLAAVCAVVDTEMDAHHYNNVLGQVQSILQLDMPADVLLSCG